ncbi:MAG TPA: SH3 domain-containing protein [Novosphingobium sp.]|nr:SH3 domain-containing protein [Novosphingobium sp.]
MSFRAASAFIFLALTTPAMAADNEVPYWVSLRSTEVNMRVGPGEDYKISWVYHRQQLPLKVLRLKESWRLVQDHEGTQGWMMSRFLTRERHAVVVGNGPAEMRQKSAPDAQLLWRVAPGVVGKLGDCSGGWCGFEITGRFGFVPQDRLWGAGEP